MCGIAGIFSINGTGKKFSKSILSMTDQMVDRGPDDEGFLLVDSDFQSTSYSGKDTPAYSVQALGYPKIPLQEVFDKESILALGHRRLSIVDLSPMGHQPMCSHDGNYWVVFNGEIYNYQEIAKELKQLGWNFKGHSDTEVLLASYIQWGKNCLNKFNGMFAFVIWDKSKSELFCARDRIGIKPFYYTIQNGNFIFGSDIKTLLASGLVEADIDYEGLYFSMAFGISPRPKTAFKNIVALEQSHYMTVSLDGKLERQRYWSMPVGTQNNSMKESEAVELLEEKLTESIKRRLIADVPVGSFMSGGIDSTTVTAIASKLHPGIKAFTLGYENTAPELDEIPQAMATAKLNSMEHIVKKVDPNDTLVDLDSWIDGYEEPFHDLAANHVVSKLVKENNVKVVLNGLGGDELFAGYGRYGRLKHWHKLKHFGGFGKLIAPFTGKYKDKLEPFLNSKSADRLHTTLFANQSDSELQRLFKHDSLTNLNTPEYLHHLYAENMNFSDEVEAFSYMDVMNYIGNHHVHRADQFTMMHSIEGRFPFLDHELIEAAYSIPSHLKLNGNVKKYVLRKVAEKHIAPECLSMAKKGFGLPLKNWMNGALKEDVLRGFNDLLKLDFLNGDEVKRVLAQYKSGNFNPQKVWHLVALAKWHNRFIKN